MGYLNRYHFPHPSVVQKYRYINAMMMNTADAGAIHVSLNDLRPVFYREQHKRYWNN